MTSVVLGHIPFAIIGILFFGLPNIDGLKQFLLKKSEVKGFVLAVVTGFFIASYSLVDGYGARVTQNPVGFYSVMTIVNGFIFYVFARWKEKEILKRIILSGRMYFFIGGTASYVAYGIVVWACLYLPIAVVSSLRETSILFAVLLGVFFLKEKINLTTVSYTHLRAHET